MANIVSSLFGLSVPDAEAQLKARQLQEHKDFAAAISKGTLQPGKSYAGAMIGQSLGAAIGNKLFGIQDPTLLKANAIQDALKAAVESTPVEQRGNRGIVMGKVAELLSANPNLQREALEATLEAAKFNKEDTDAASDLAYKKSLTDYYGMLQLDKASELEGKKFERQAQVAYGAVSSLEKAKDPAAQTKIWENALTALEKQGFDTSTIKDIPWEQRTDVLNGIVDSSETSTTRMKREVATVKAEAQSIINDEKIRHNKAMEALTTEKNALTERLADQRIAAAERIALENKVNGINAQMDRLDKTNAWRTQGQYTSQIGTKEFDKNSKNYLKETLGLNDQEVAKALPIFNAAYGKYLGTKDEQGYPKYDNLTALNMAKKDIEGGSKKVYSTFGGVRVPGTTKSVYTGEAPKVIKLD